QRNHLCTLNEFMELFINEHSSVFSVVALWFDFYLALISSISLSAGSVPSCTVPPGSTSVGVPKKPRDWASFILSSISFVPQLSLLIGLPSKLSSIIFNDLLHSIAVAFQYASLCAARGNNF